MQLTRRTLPSILFMVALVFATCGSGPSGGPTDTVKEMTCLVRPRAVTSSLASAKTKRGMRACHAQKSG